MDPDRLIFAKKKPIEEHLARHQLADLFLDTIPCNAHTTARDALTAGLPVLTLMGDTFASRVAASIGQTTDGGVHVAESIDAYKQLAISKPVIALGAPQVTKSNFVAEFEKALNRVAEGVTRNKGSCIRQELASDAPLFEVVVTGLRLGEFFEECLASIGQQSYRQFRVHLLPDMDPENTIGDPSEIASKFEFPSGPVVKAAPVRVGKAALIYDHVINFDFAENSIIVILDGDDRFASAEALKVFAEKYKSEKPDACWSTYIRSDGVLGHSAPLIKGFSHRRQGWKSSHCFTFRAGLVKHVPRSYILDESGSPVMQACDIALALPILDLASRTSFIPEALYRYEVGNPKSHHNQKDGIGLTSRRQMETANYLYRKTPLISLNS